MKTLLEFANEVVNIQQALNEIEIKGARNAGFIIYCDEKCKKIINDLNEAMTSAPAGDIEIAFDENQNGDDEYGDNS